MHRLFHLLTKCPACTGCCIFSPSAPTPDCPSGPIEESLGADRVVVSPTGHPSATGVVQTISSFCPRLRGRYRSTQAAGVRSRAGCQARPLQGTCAGCRCGRYRSTALPPVAGACYRGMRTPVATGPRRWLQVRPLQEHCAAAGGWCEPLYQGTNHRRQRSAP